MSTVVIEGLLYSAKRVLSKPVTAISSGTRQPALSKPLMPPIAVRSLMAMTAVGRGGVLRDRQARRQPAFKAQVAAEDRSGLKPQIPHAFVVAFETTLLDLSLGRPRKQCAGGHSCRDI